MTLDNLPSRFTANLTYPDHGDAGDLIFVRDGSQADVAWIVAPEVDGLEIGRATVRLPDHFRFDVEISTLDVEFEYRATPVEQH